MLNKVILVFLTILLGQSVLAQLVRSPRTALEMTYDEVTEQEGCEAYDLRPTLQEMGLPDRQFQGQSGWCYAFVASDLLSYRLGEPVSAADIAINYINQNPDLFFRASDSLAQFYPLGGGYTTRALESLSGRGVCRDADFPINLSAAEPSAEIVVDPVTGARRKVDGLQPVLDSRLGRFFTDARITQRMTMIRQSSFIHALNELSAREPCTPAFTDLRVQPRYESWRGDERSHTDREAFKAHINLLLTKKKMVAVTYDQSVLRTGAVASMRERVDDRHISTIVGRRFNSEKSRCEYLVRNSEGVCAYNEDFDCSNNHIWIPRQILLWSVGAVVYLEN